MGAYEFSIPPCTAPPAITDATAIPNSGICMGAQVALSANGYILSAGQTFQWQFATTSTGPWTNLGGTMIMPDTTIFATGTLYYRVSVTCSGNTSFRYLLRQYQFFIACIGKLKPCMPGRDLYH